MQATVYANLTTRRLTTTLGGSAISFPAFVQGDKVRIGLRFAESLEGSPIEVQKIVTHIDPDFGRTGSDLHDCAAAFPFAGHRPRFPSQLV